jgi:hypothetical protein
VTASGAQAHSPVDCKEDNPLNNNRGSNRRRGRGNNRQQGGNQANRIDSRARGNAPQLLEKYRKLAHDASLNGDRVQAEYYLQFADHYFRVIADSRAQREEQRPSQPGNRDQSYDEEFRDDDDQYHRVPRENGRENGRDAGRDGRRERPNDGRREQTEREPDDRDGDDEERDAFEPVENPFVREGRGRRPNGERPSRARREPAGEEAAEGTQQDEGPRFDPSSLPPSFSAGDEEEPKPRRTRARKPRASGNENGSDKGGEELETVS